MTITTTQLGTYTTQITLSGEVNGLGMITALDAAIVAAGWTQWDISTPTRVYRILNRDGVTYKYVGIFIDPYNNKINTTVYESWDATLHTALNEVTTFGRTGEMGSLYSNTDIILMVSPNWLILQTFISNQPSQWSGVIEFERELAEDTTAYPCFAWVCSSLIMNKSPTGSLYPFVSFPRTKLGYTVLGAATPMSWSTPSLIIGSNSGTGGEALVPYTTYPWDTTKKNIHSLRPILNGTEIHGRAIGLKALYNAGAPFNKITVPVDTNLNYSITGTNTEHWLLGETIYSPTVFSPVTGGTGYMLGTSNNVLTSPGIAVVDTGVFYYITTSAAAGLQKLSSTGTLGTLINVAGAPSTAQDVIFDGQYVYVATATGISRFDTLNADAVSTLALTNGAATLFYDGTSVWASARGSRINTMIYKVAASTFTLSSTITLPNVTTSAIGGMCTNNAGILAVTTTLGPLYTVNIGTGVVSTLASTFATTPMTQVGVTFDGVRFIFGGSATGNSNNTLLFVNATTFVEIGRATFSTTSSGAQFVKANICKYGPFVIIPQGSTGNAIGTIFPNTNYSSAIAALPANMLAQSTSMLYTDGTKLFGLGSSGFFQYLNINHPDDGATAHGRFAIPK